MRKTSRQRARIAWRRGQWATVEEFLRGEAQKRKVGPGMHEPCGKTPPACDYFGRPENDGYVREHLDLDHLERKLR